MSATNITSLPSRIDIVASHEQQAQVYLRRFDPKVYSNFYARIYDADAYLEQVGIEKICELIEHGNSILGIAQKLDISVRTVRQWIGKSQYRQGLIKEAYNFAGDGFAFKAEQVLKDAAGGTKEEVSIAKALAQHYEWMATKLSREMYGEVKKDDGGDKKPVMNIHLNFGGEVKQEEVTVKQDALVASFINLSAGE